MSRNANELDKINDETNQVLVPSRTGEELWLLVQEKTDEIYKIGTEPYESQSYNQPSLDKDNNSIENVPNTEEINDMDRDRSIKNGKDLWNKVKDNKNTFLSKRSGKELWSIVKTNNQNIIKMGKTGPTSPEKSFYTKLKDNVFHGVRDFFGLESEDNNMNLNNWNEVTFKILNENNIFGGQLKEKKIDDFVEKIKDKNPFDLFVHFKETGEILSEKKKNFGDIVIQTIRKKRYDADENIDTEIGTEKVIRQTYKIKFSHIELIKF